MEQNLLMVQKQTLQLSPQMYQSIKILQLNSIELNCWLEKEVQDNPVLEINLNPISDQETMSDAAKKRDEKDVNGERDVALLDYFSSRKKFINDQNVSSFEQGSEKKVQKWALGKISLAEYLLLNFGVMARDELEAKIGEYLIGNIDNNGYLAISCQEAAQDLNIPEKK